jgi:hypothetical protein
MIQGSLNVLFLLVVGCAVVPADDSEPVATTSQDLQSFNLTVGFTGRGFGMVSANPLDDNFRSACVLTPCTFEYVAGTPSQVVLTATPFGVSTFSSWLGCPHPSGATCTVDNNAPTLGVTANFACSGGINQQCRIACLRSCHAGGGSGPECASECNSECDACLNG